MIPTILMYPERDLAKARRLAAFCRELDGTEIILIQARDGDGEYPVNRHGCIAAEQLHIAAKLMGEPFLWMECDSIPLKPGFIKALGTEYHRLKKPFMVSSDSQGNDLVGGIGIYDAKAVQKVLPKQYPDNSWDLWMIRNVPEMVARTKLIQHSYAIYFNGKRFTPHQFPRDNDILRYDAYIFHADKQQGLIDQYVPQVKNSIPDNRPVFLHSGDLGDIVASLAAVKTAGGGHYLVTDKRSGQREPMTERRYRALKRLLEHQEYVDSATYTLEPKNVTHDFTTFRIRRPGYGHNLAQWQAGHVGVTINMQPWLTAPPNPVTKGKVIISQSARYRNPAFPWNRILEHVGDRALFIGTEEEHKAFTGIPRLVTEDLFDVAGAIAGAEMFIGNQSCPFWIAAGLGVPLIQQVCPTQADSMVLRDNAFYPQSEYDFGKILHYLSKSIDNFIQKY